MKKNIEETINKLCSLTVDGFEECQRRLNRLEKALSVVISATNKSSLKKEYSDYIYKVQKDIHKERIKEDRNE
jgi:hypothetical protein